MTRSGSGAHDEHYRLANAEDRHREAPRYFFIPDEELRRALTPGDIAKVIFEPVGTGDDGPAPERMWVEVTEARTDGYSGVLANSPFYLTAVKLGDPVAFRPEHIIAVYEEEEWELLDLQMMITERSHEEDRQPEIVFREDPTDDGDSGWRALLGDETEEDEMLTQQAGFVLQRWPQLQAVFETDPANGFWEWDEDSGNYVPTTEEALSG